MSKYSQLIVCKHNEQQVRTKITIAFYSCNIKYQYKRDLRTVWFDISIALIAKIAKIDIVGRSYTLYRRSTVDGCL
jgi:hypothetical protein